MIDLWPSLVTLIVAVMSYTDILKKDFWVQEIDFNNDKF